MNNKGLKDANKAKKDEFYTQYETIKKELKYYPAQQFHNKIIYCNCDSYPESQFIQYFKNNFHKLKLKKLISTSYINKQSNFFSNDQSKKPIKYELSNDKEKITQLKDNGDFRSQECIEILKQADIIITNPPFSLFNEFFAQLMKHKKKFLILGNLNAITCKNIFPCIKNRSVSIGPSVRKGDIKFRVSDNYPLNAATSEINQDGNKFIRVKSIRWFTNLQYDYEQKPLDLTCSYSPEEYPFYDNYEIIEVSKTALIPKDYDYLMGVPITFIDKWDPQQFEIKFLSYLDTDHMILHGKKMYRRLIIQRILERSDEN